MKQFSLEEYLKNPNRHIVTRKGTDAKIICTDGSDKKYPILALIQNEEGKDVLSYTNDGMNVEGYENQYDLFFATEKKTGWVNIYNQRTRSCGFIYESEEKAKLNTDKTKIYIATVKIEWEE